MSRLVRNSLVVAVAGFVMAACSVFGGKAAEEPPHQVVIQDGNFQIRTYGAYVVAQTYVDEPFDDAVGTGFSRLFGYISGANQGMTEIQMTAPVISAPRRDTEAVAVFVEQFKNGAGGWTIGFVLPDDYTIETAPRPKNELIEIIEIPEHSVAAVRFTGSFDNEAAEKKRELLAEWLETKQQEHLNDWKMAGYNPPWTIPFLRRNEVIVTLR
jgi:hypothetical protein